MNFKSIMALRDLVKPAYLQRAARTTTGLVGGTVLGAGMNSGYPMGTGEDLPVPLRFAAGGGLARPPPYQGQQVKLA